jgi:hypothetical protein
MSDALLDAFTTFFVEGGRFASILEARQYASNVLGKRVAPGTPEAKLVEECAERGIVRAASRILETANTSHEAFDRLVDLYDRQPNLSTRSSTSIGNQAYSTPVPIAYLVSALAQVAPGKTTYEPTAGHGALLIGADKALAYVNELNPERVKDLRVQGYRNVTQMDAIDYLPPEPVDIVVENPPFGVIQENGRPKQWTVRGGNATPAYTTTQIDHAIALKSLRAMKDDGRAVLILGAPMGNKTGNQADASASYNSGQNRAFYKSLYDNYNVTEHVCVAGNLYAGQGTSYPVDIFVIEGRGKSSRPLPAAELPPVYTTFADLKELIPNVSLSRNQPSLDASNPELSSPRANSRTDAAATDRNSDDQGLHEPLIGSSGLDAAGLGRAEPGDGRGSLPDDRPSSESSRTLPIGTTGDERSNTGMGGSSDDDQLRATGAADLSASSFQPNGGLAGGGESDIPVSPTTDDRTRAGGDQDAHWVGNAERVAGTNGHSFELEQSDATQQIGETPMATEEVLREEQVKQVAYSPQSQGTPAGTLLPANMQTAVKDALVQLEKQVGSIDQFVERKVGIADQPVKPFAEQIDAIALAIDNVERGDAFILGDQTGIGKGLQLASISKAQIQGNINYPGGDKAKTIVFVSYDPKLYADFIRDLNDVGLTNVKPLVTNSDFKLETPNGTLKTGSGKVHTELLRKIGATGDLGDYNIIFTTYSQLQTVKGEETTRRNFLRSIVKDSLLILDESHNAGGTPQEFYKAGPANRADFVRGLVRNAKGVVFSSATYAKSPYVMSLYAARTGMRHAVSKEDNFVEMVQAGGIPLQQMLSAKLTESGAYIRRERSYEGIEFGATVAEVDKSAAENLATIMNRIMQFDEEKQAAVKRLDRGMKAEARSILGDTATGGAGATSTNFTSLMHNVIGQTLLSMKAEATVQEALKALRNNEKPVITLANTMGSLIGSAAEDQVLKPGDPIDLTVGDLLKRYLERSRDVLIKDAFGKKERYRLTDDQLSEEALEIYESTMALIDEIDWDNMPVSPIDYIRHRLEEEGYKTSEITGRTERIEYGESGEQLYQVRGANETKTSSAVANVNKFNAGDIDVMILNRSGSTGISLHASERFKDQRPRRMIITQPELDINQFMQMLGRIHRTGQVELPRFTLLMGDIPAEKRPGAVLLKKMASLNANTTAARESGFSLESITDFMNDYGDQVAVEVMAANPKIHKRLGNPIKDLDSGEDKDIDVEKVDTENAINRLTGRIPALPISEQERIYKLIETEYNELVAREQAMGNNILEAETLELDAKPLARMEVMPKREGVRNVFAEAVYLEVVDCKSPRKPLSQLEVVNLLRVNKGMEPVENLENHDFEQFMRDSRSQAYESVRDLRDQTLQYRNGVMEKARRSLTAEIELGEEVPAEISAKIAERSSKLDERLNKQCEKVFSTLRKYPVGQAVKLMNNKDGSIYYGVVQGFVDKNGADANPLTPSSWKMQIQVADGARQITVPFTKINTEAKSGIRVEVQEQDYDGINIYDLFDQRQTTLRENRQIFTGNVIRAYEEYKGKLVNFRDAKGEIHQGVLMPKSFSIEQQLEKQAIRIPDPETCQEFYRATNRTGLLKTSDEVLQVMSMNDGTLCLYCPKQKDTGGIYFLDAGLLQAAGDDREFISAGKEMRMYVKPQYADQVLAYLYQHHDGLMATNNLGKARELLGIELPEFKDITEEILAFAPPVVDEATPEKIAALESLVEGVKQPDFDDLAAIPEEQALAAREAAIKAIQSAFDQTIEDPTVEAAETQISADFDLSNLSPEQLQRLTDLTGATIKEIQALSDATAAIIKNQVTEIVSQGVPFEAAFNQAWENLMAEAAISSKDISPQVLLESEVSDELELTVEAPTVETDDFPYLVESTNNLAEKFFITAGFELRGADDFSYLVESESGDFNPLEIIKTGDLVTFTQYSPDEQGGIVSFQFSIADQPMSLLPTMLVGSSDSSIYAPDAALALLEAWVEADLPNKFKEVLESQKALNVDVPTVETVEAPAEFVALSPEQLDRLAASTGATVQEIQAAVESLKAQIAEVMLSEDMSFEEAFNHLGANLESRMQEFREPEYIEAMAENAANAVRPQKPEDLESAAAPNRYLILSAYPEELVEQPEQLNKVGPFADRMAEEEFLIDLGDVLKDAQSVTYFSAGFQPEHRQMAKGLEPISPDAFLERVHQEIAIDHSAGAIDLVEAEPEPTVNVTSEEAVSKAQVEPQVEPVPVVEAKVEAQPESEVVEAEVKVEAQSNLEKVEPVAEEVEPVPVVEAIVETQPEPHMAEPVAEVVEPQMVEVKRKQPKRKEKEELQQPKRKPVKAEKPQPEPKVVEAEAKVETQPELQMAEPVAEVVEAQKVEVKRKQPKRKEKEELQQPKRKPVKAEKPQVEEAVDPTVKPEPKISRTEQKQNLAVESMGLNPLEITHELIAKHDPKTLVALQKADATKERYSPSLREMRDWLVNAKELSRDEAYLERIKQLGNQMFAGTDEVFKTPKERNSNFRNEDFTLSNAATKAMRRDAQQTQNQQVAQMGAKILSLVGQDNGKEVVFERPNGNYQLKLDKKTQTFTIYARNRNEVILTVTKGEVKHEQSSASPMDVQTFKAFLEAVQQRSVTKLKQGGR